MGTFRHMERRPSAEMRSRGNNSGSPIDLASVDFTCAAREPAPSAIASMGRAAPPSAMAGVDSMPLPSAMEVRAGQHRPRQWRVRPLCRRPRPRWARAGQRCCRPRLRERRSACLGERRPAVGLGGVRWRGPRFGLTSAANGSERWE